MKNYIFSSRKKLQKTRVVAVQAAYSYEINPACEDSGIYAEDFLKLYNDGQLTERPLLIQKDENILIDQEFFKTLLHYHYLGASDNLDLVKKYLNKGRGIHSIEPLVKVIILLATVEMRYFGDFSGKSIINNYIGIAKLFMNDAEIGFVNFILDKLFKEIRAEK